jgi:MFS transporter, ACS family, hexuronate transporter
MTGRLPWRWIAVSVFALSNSLNFLDRQILAALAPTLMHEFRMNASQYGDVILVFSLTYALAAPFAGLLIDRLGLNRGSSLAVGVWSLAGISTGLTSSLAGLTACRAALGLGEAGGLPGTGKSSALYLLPRERAFGSAISQVGLTIGGVAAPLVAQFFALRYGWRSAFVFAGAIGFLWIPLWLLVSRRAPKLGEERSAPSVPVRDVIRDPRFWALLAANFLLMSVYSLWVNWTTVFLVRQHGLSQQDANYSFAWIPPVFATAGGFLGGWLTFRWSAGHKDVTGARMKVILLGALILLSGLAIPFLPTAGLATAAICLSFCACVAASVNIYSMPLDFFGPARAAFAVSALTSVYGLLQGAFSALVGRVVDGYGFAPVCVLAALLPMGSWGILWLVLRRRKQ